MIILLTIKQGM